MVGDHMVGKVEHMVGDQMVGENVVSDQTVGEHMVVHTARLNTWCVNT
jgi:hypothetical protein